MLQFIFGSAKSGKTTKVFQLLGEKAATNKESLLFVPEQFSFETERLLLEKLGDVAASRVKVLSFSSFCTEIFRLYGGAQGKTINDTSRLLILQKTLRELEGELQLFKSYESAVNSIATISATVAELKQCGVSPDELDRLASETENELLSMKLHDMSLIISAYEATVKNVYIDPLDQLDTAYNKARDNGYFKYKTVFFDSYNGFTGQQSRLINQMFIDADDVYASFDYSLNHTDDEFHLFSNIVNTVNQLKQMAIRQNVECSKPIYLSENCNSSVGIKALCKLLENGKYECGDSRGIKIINAATPYTELDYVARTIRKAVRTEGARYRDFVVISRNVTDCIAAARSAFKKYSVPLFYDEKQPFSAMQAAAFVLYALSATRSYKSSDIMQWLKTGLTDFTEQEIADIDNYVYLWNIDGDEWCDDWNKNPFGLNESSKELTENTLNRLNGYRKSIFLKLFNIAKLKRGTAEEFCKALFLLLTDCNVAKHLNEVAEEHKSRGEYSVSQYIESSWKMLCDILDSIVNCFGKDELSFAEFKGIIEMCFGNSGISGIPQSVDTVTLTSADRFAPSGVKKTFLVGVNYGEFPATSFDSGFFTVTERGILNGFNVPVSDRYLADYIMENYLFYRAAASPSEQLYLLYHNGKLSGEKCEASRIVEKIRKELNPDFSSAEQSVQTELHLETPAEAFAIAADNKADGILWNQITSTLDGVEDYTQKIAAVNEYEKPQGSIRQITAHKLYGSEMHISPSKIEQFFKCPYAYFLKYGIGVKQREQIDFKRMQRGTIAHFVLERILCNHFEEISYYDTYSIKKLVKSYISLYLALTVGENYVPNGEAKYLLLRIEDMLCELLPDIIKELKLSSFKPRYFELDISANGDLPPLTVKGDDCTAIVGGKVDRVDEMNSNGKCYLRVVDYKTGKKAFKMPDVLYGLNLQMLLYLCIICENLPKVARPAAVIYQPINPKKREGINCSEKDTAKPKGLLTDNVEILMQMDPTKSFMPFKLKKDGTPSKTDNCISTEDFYCIFDYIKAQVKNMCRKLRNGDIENIPCNHGTTKSDDICSYCDYRPLCRRDENSPSRTVEKMSKDEVLDAIRKGSDIWE